MANQTLQDANARQLGFSAAASRATSKASSLYRNEDWDLVDRMKNDPKFDVKKVSEDELCEELKKMKPEQREGYVKEMAAKRDGLQKEIADLNAKRQAYIAEQMKKNGTKADQAFDVAIRGALRGQAAKKGIEIPEK
jgi:hypothetical protein